MALAVGKVRIVIKDTYHRLVAQSYAGHKLQTPPMMAIDRIVGRAIAPYICRRLYPGLCNICGKPTAFIFDTRTGHRESMICAWCGSTSRYRSISRGILEAIRQLTTESSTSLASLSCSGGAERKIRIYDTQVSFRYRPCAYLLPEYLRRADWIDVVTSQYDPSRSFGSQLSDTILNQNLERLTFGDAEFDIVVTTDVMEHVRLDDLAHREIYRVLKPGGFYLFTVPHVREWEKTLERVKIVDPEQPALDEQILEPEYHGDANSADSRVLAYRTYGRDLDARLEELGFAMTWTRKDFPLNGIRGTELFLCRKRA